MSIHTGGVSSSCLAAAQPSVAWHRRPWRDPASASGHQHSQNGKDFEACPLPQRHHRSLQRGWGDGERRKTERSSSSAMEKVLSLWRANSRVLTVLSVARRAHLRKLGRSPGCNLKGRSWCFLKTVWSKQNMYLHMNISGALVCHEGCWD